MWMEISFNLGYLIVVWGLVITMVRKRDVVGDKDQKVAYLVIWAFALLALGDTGHVGFRVIAYALGDLEATFSLFGISVGWVGLGALSTAITVTLFYVLMVYIWKERFGKSLGWFEIGLLVAAAARFVVMVFPGNEWNSTVPPVFWGPFRNVFLIILGLGVAYLILRDARVNRDSTFTWIGICILISYALYMPVVFFVRQVPLLGMLMIPKTIAYVVVGFLAYNELYRESAKTQQLVSDQV
jgi:hypothetical protein